MSPEENKLFDEFKVALDATQVHTYESYIKPDIDGLVKANQKLNQKVNSYLIIITSLILVILTLLTFAEFIKIKSVIENIITKIGI